MFRTEPRSGSVVELIQKQFVPAVPDRAFSNTVLFRTVKGRASWVASDVSHNRNHLGSKLQTLRLGRIARICAAVCGPMLSVFAVQPKEHWDFASHASAGFCAGRGR
jgi:hypothetical protein